MNKYLCLLIYLIPATAMIWFGMYQTGNPQWMPLVFVIGTMVTWGALAKESEEFASDVVKTNVIWFVESNLCAAITLGVQFFIIRFGLGLQATFGFIAVPLCYLCFGVALFFFYLMLKFLLEASLWLTCAELGIILLFGALSVFLFDYHITPLFGYEASGMIKEITRYTMVASVALFVVCLFGYVFTNAAMKEKK